MSNEREMLPDKSPKLAVEILKENLMERLGLTEEKLSKLDPYKWADHYERYLIWIIRGYIELAEPKDPKMRFDLLTHGGTIFSGQAAFTFRHLDADKTETFRKNIEDLGFKINQMPPKEGPWSQFAAKYQATS